MARRAALASVIIAAFALPRVALARDAPVPDALDDVEPRPFDDEGIDLGGLEDEALGPRGKMRTRAESVSFDAKQRSLELAGNVRIDAPPFHLRSDHLTLARTRYGIEVDGNGRLAFCPCLGTPLTVEFSKAIVAPPGELLLRDPKLEIYGVPVMYLPWFWLRSEEKIGVLPPDIAYRGQDGLFVGEGVHLPWKDGGGRRALDLRGGVYFDGGFAVDARLHTPSSTTTVRYDRLPGAHAPELPFDARSPGTGADDGLLVDARGASHRDATTVAWDADMIRGRRGVVATSDLEAAAKPWDRASASGALRLGPFVGELGARAVTRRGGDLTTVEASGPFVALRSSGVVAPGVTFDAAVEGGSLRASGTAANVATLAPPSLTPNTVSYARAEAGGLAATTFGPFAASLSARAAGDLAVEQGRDGGDRAATARLRIGAPFLRAWAEPVAAETRDPLLHVIEPFAEASMTHASGNAILGTLPGRGLATLDGTAPITDAGLSTSFGRWGRREALELSVAGGAAYGSNATPSGVRPLGRGRLSASLAWLGALVETGHVIGSDSRSRGGAVVARVRVGRSDGLRVVANVATRSGIDPILARALTDASLEVPAGFLSQVGTTGGAGLVVPWAHAVTTSAGADVDASTGDLVAARAGIDLRDSCGCVTVRTMASHRIGRDGVDVWVALDFATGR